MVKKVGKKVLVGSTEGSLGERDLSSREGEKGWHEITERRKNKAGCNTKLEYRVDCSIWGTDRVLDLQKINSCDEEILFIN